MGNLGRRAPAVPVVAVAVGIALLFLLPPSPAAATAAAHPTLELRGPPGPTSAPSPGGSPRPLASASAGGGNGNAALGKSLASREVFPPGPDARKLGSGEVAPGYTSGPAPVGLSDLGVNRSGPYAYNSTQFVGTLTFASEPVVSNPGYAAFAEAPNWMAVQLNTVAVNVSYSRVASGTYWIQNVVHDNGTVLEFEDNVWNFTSATSGMQPGTLLNPKGTVVPGEYYYRNGPTIPVTYPLTLVLSNAVQYVAGHPTVYLNYTVSDHAGTVSGSYDTIVFAGAVDTPVPRFEVDGFGENAAEHLDDAELTLGGDGSGASATVLSLDASATLQYVNGVGGLENVPAAYDFGADTGETSNGLSAYYVGTVEHLDAGPTLLWGLWNTSSGSIAPAATPGWVWFNATVSPSYGFLFLTTHDELSASPAEPTYFDYVPTNATGSVNASVAPPAGGDPYELLAWADGFQNSSPATAVPLSANQTGVAVSLTASSSTENAPVYLATLAQAEALAAHLPAATFSARHDTLWLNASTVTFAVPFLATNDYLYPTFVLFAEEALNVSVRVNAFEETPSPQVYRTDLGEPWTVAQWGQGYYFLAGNGTDSASNLTLPGNSVAYHAYGTDPPAAVEFYATLDSSAIHVTSSEESFGVTAVNATDTTVTDVTSNAGANAATAVYATGFTARNVLGNGTDAYFVESWGVYLVNATGTRVTDLSGTNASVALVTQDAPFVVTDVRVVQSIALVANNSSASTLTNISVNDSELSTYTGFWAYSDGVTIRNASVVGFGFDLIFDRDVTVVGLNVSQAVSDGVDAFFDSTGGTFRWVNATGGALGLNLSDSERTTVENLTVSGEGYGVINVDGNVSTIDGLSVTDGSFGVLWFGGTNGTVSDVTVTEGSVGVWAQNVSNLTTRWVSAADTSIAVSWNGGGNGTVQGINATSASLGAWVQNVTNVSVTTVDAQETAYAGPFTFNPTLYDELPVAAVALANDSEATVQGVVAVRYGFGLLSNDSLGGMTVTDLAAWDGGFAVSLNTTNNTTASELFSFGNSYGLFANNSSNLSVRGSTFEASASYGVYALNGTSVALSADNFVSNHGASVTGHFASGHVQVKFVGTVGPSVSSNFWSDHSGASGYSVAKGIVDETPAGAFLGNAVEFNEVGLRSGTVWTMGITDGPLTVGYPTTSSLFYIPSWVLASGTVAYAVGVPGYTAYPASGTFPYSGQSANLTIVFNSTHPANGGGLPIDLLVGGAVAAVLVVLVVVLVVRARRRERDAEPEQDPNWNP
jgi:hypothetical protein